MANEKLKKCCCGEPEKLTRKIKQSDLCPACKMSGIKVKNYTVKNLVLDELAELVGDMDYYLCRNEKCDIVYYNVESNLNFNKQKVKVPIWFKENANPKYVCYCSKVTEAQVINAVVNDGAKSVDDIVILTGAMKNSQCQRNNPLGTCCHQIIQDAIDKALTMK
jgi:bacterioferritin-associated ferredoxin